MFNQEFMHHALRAVLVVGWIGASASLAGAGVVAGGGPRSQDCLAVFDTPAALLPTKRTIRCVDGDPACDGDGLVNGECKFPVAVCANSTFEPLCSLSGVQSMFLAHADDNGDPKFDPDFQALQSRIDNTIDPPSPDPDSCTSPSNIIVRLKGPYPGNRCRSATKTLKLTTTSTFQAGRFYTDTDGLKLTCRPAVDSCDPATLFSGTFDRIQKQVLNTTCAVSGCHDSQTQANGLLLEVGAAYTQLVGAVPTNVTAQGLGWDRVTPGDPATSLLFHKITGDVTVALGSRMPLGRPPLAANLIEIIRLWIAAGAPETGWVPGTDS